MFYDNTIAGSWTALVDRLDATSTVDRWAADEPGLAGVRSVEQLHALLAPGGDPGRADELLGGLIRLAAVDGARDDDALLVVLHCLSGLVLSLARDLADLSEDIVAVVVGELTCQVRTYARRGRTRAFAANLRFETRRAVLKELRPSVRHHPECGERVTDDGDVERLVTGPAASPTDVDEDLDVVELLLWAVSSGVDAEGVRLLVATEHARARSTRRVNGDADSDVAREFGLCTRTLYRRRGKTLAALRSAAQQYVADVA
ncbi:hypothetical protein ACXR2U_01040 [Jatrophihabitans sp. YIM 134969]